MGLAARLAEEWEKMGVESTLQVNTGNYFDEEQPFVLSASMARESVKEEIRLESLWFKFLERSNSVNFKLRIWGRWLHFFSRWQSHSQTKELRRLLNIEFSHLDLYRNAIESGSDWAVILEDDAFAEDPLNLAVNLLSLINHSEDVKMINLSTSYSPAEIGVEHLLTQVQEITWKGDPEVLVFSSARPATNTVCAIAFRTEFLSSIVSDIANQPVASLVPIDWKLNGSLMRLWDGGVIKRGECWFVEPGPILQLSMHRNPAS